MKTIQHTSKHSKDHRVTELAVAWIRAQGLNGIKRGNLMTKLPIAYSSFQVHHQVLVDLDEISWDKSTRTYTSSTPPQVDDADLV